MGKIPPDFYKLFASKYMGYYVSFLVAVHEESSRSYSVLGLTEQECRAVINEKLTETTIDWDQDRFDEEGELLTRSNMASVCLGHFVDWGWLRRDFDETLNSYVLSFPEYSRLFVELFQKLSSEEDGAERESVLAVYSYLFTYSSDPEKNNEMLKSAWKTSRRLTQMLSNMQEGMRGYFDELSRKKDFRGIQEVLVKEINNTDSRRYAILTTTDSFYRYKEAVKELIDRNLRENELRRQELELRRGEEPEGTPAAARAERAVELCTEAMDLLYQIEREFDVLERRYNQLIEQKTVFAGRAAARIRYLLQEGAQEEDQTVLLVNLLDHGKRKEELLEELAARMKVTSSYRVITEKSFYSRRDKEKEAFLPGAVAEAPQAEKEELGEFVLRPLYTGKELRDFWNRSQKDGVFRAGKDTVRSMEDLEKLFFIWQEMTEQSEGRQEIEIGEEVETEEGFRFSSLTVKNADRRK
ncbi:hypothetical protein B5F29_14095 [Lachnoclostridium sp. An196]|nr:hypothetical protein B5F29_14095 [Lachnoclostridium sp. An196]